MTLVDGEQIAKIAGLVDHWVQMAGRIGSQHRGGDRFSGRSSGVRGVSGA